MGSCEGRGIEVVAPGLVIGNRRQKANCSLQSIQNLISTAYSHNPPPATASPPSSRANNSSTRQSHNTPQSPTPNTPQTPPSPPTPSDPTARPTQSRPAARSADGRTPSYPRTARHPTRRPRGSGSPASAEREGGLSTGGGGCVSVGRLGRVPAGGARG